MKHNFKPLRYSELSLITFKRLVHYIVLIIVFFIPLHLLVKDIDINLQFIIDHVVIVGIVFFMVLILFLLLEFKLIWSKITFFYPIHEREIPPLTAAILLEIFYNILVML